MESLAHVEILATVKHPWWAEKVWRWSREKMLSNKWQGMEQVHPQVS